MKNKYIEAGLIAFFVGAISASGVFLVAFPEGIEWHKMVSLVGIAFIGPFAALAKALPDPSRIINPATVTAENVESMPVTVTNVAPTTDVPSDAPPAPLSAVAVPTKGAARGSGRRVG